MMKKNLRLIIILAVILSLCIGLYAVITLTNRSEDDDTETTLIRLNDLTDAAVITVKNSNGTMEFINNGDSWTYTGDETLSIDPTKLASLKQAIVGLTALREIDAVDSLSAYGLDKNAITVTAEDGDGKVFKIDIGNEIATGDGHYALISGSDKIFIISNDLYDASSFNINDIIS